MDNVYILARAPGGQMQGAATQAMQGHRRGAATNQMPARRSAPPGYGPARSLAALLTPCMHPGMLVARALPASLGAAAKCKRYSLTGPKQEYRRKYRISNKEFRTAEVGCNQHFEIRNSLFDILRFSKDHCGAIGSVLIG